MRKKLRKLAGYVSILVKTGILIRMPAVFGAAEIQPASCNLMITNRCNLRCVMCRQWREKPQDELSTDAWRAIVDDLRMNGIRNIHFTGGEPLLREDLVGLVGYANSRGFTVGMTSNGFLMTRDIVERLCGAGIRSIVISMDALGAGYDKVRGVQGAFDRVKEAARLIADAKKMKGIDASINFTLMRDTIDQFRHVKEFADSLGLPIAICLLDDTSSIFRVKENANDFWIRDAADVARLAGLLDFLKETAAEAPRSILLNIPAIDYIRAYFEDPIQKRIPCVSSQDRIVIDPYGNLLGGCMAMGAFGNLGATPFGVLRKDRKYRAAKRNMFYKNCPGCSCGYLFNIKCLPGLAARGLARRVALIFGGRGPCRKTS